MIYRRAVVLLVVVLTASLLVACNSAEERLALPREDCEVAGPVAASWPHPGGFTVTLADTDLGHAATRFAEHLMNWDDADPATVADGVGPCAVLVEGPDGAAVRLSLLYDNSAQRWGVSGFLYPATLGDIATSVQVTGRQFSALRRFATSCDDCTHRFEVLYDHERADTEVTYPGSEVRIRLRDRPTSPGRLVWSATDQDHIAELFGTSIPAGDFAAG